MKEELENITVSKLIESNQAAQYREILKYLAGKETIGQYKAKQFETIKWGQVMEMRQIIFDGQNNYEILKCFEWVYGIDEKSILNLKVVDFYHGLNWIIYENERLIKSEQNIGGEPDEYWIQAGGEKLGMYQHFNIMVTLGEQFGCAPHTIEDWSYGNVFLMLRYNTDMASIRKKYQQIIAKK